MSEGRRGAASDPRSISRTRRMPTATAAQKPIKHTIMEKTPCGGHVQTLSAEAALSRRGRLCMQARAGGRLRMGPRLALRKNLNGFDGPQCRMKWTAGRSGQPVSRGRSRQSTALWLQLGHAGKAAAGWAHGTNEGGAVALRGPGCRATGLLREGLGRAQVWWRTRAGTAEGQVAGQARCGSRLADRTRTSLSDLGLALAQDQVGPPARGAGDACGCNASICFDGRHGGAVRSCVEPTRHGMDKGQESELGWTGGRRPRSDVCPRLQASTACAPTLPATTLMQRLTQQKQLEQVRNHAHSRLPHPSLV